MLFHVLSIGLTEHKVFESIVVVLTVDVMDYFRRLKKASEMGFHYESMFEYISGLAFSWMTRRRHENISGSISIFTRRQRVVAPRSLMAYPVVHLGILP